jgi:hypothetical protein
MIDRATELHDHAIALIRELTRMQAETNPRSAWPSVLNERRKVGDRRKRRRRISESNPQPVR